MLKTSIPSTADPIRLSEYSLYTAAALAVRGVDQLATTSPQHFHEACMRAYTSLVVSFDDSMSRLRINLEYDMQQGTYSAFNAMILFWIYSSYGAFVKVDTFQLFMSAETGHKILTATGEQDSWLEAIDVFIDYMTEHGFAPHYRDA